MPKHAVMLNHHHHAANLNDGMMPPGLLIQKVSFFARCLNVAPQHKSPHDKVGGQRNNNPEGQQSCGNQSADDVGFHDLLPLSMAARPAFQPKLGIRLLICRPPRAASSRVN
jgi:hypothetical protein